MSSGRTSSLPMIQVNTPERLRKSTTLPKELLDLLNEVRQLREHTDSLVCNCNRRDCPFEECHIQQLAECNFDSDSSSPRVRRKGITKNIHPMGLASSLIMKGIEKRSDGTIVERDGPTCRTISGEDTLEKRLMRSYMISSGIAGKHLSVSTLSDSQDCLVDNDNLFGTSSDDDSTFSRFEQKRKHVRRKSPRIQQRRATMIPQSSTFERKSSMDSEQSGFSTSLRSAASLPSCVLPSCRTYFEDDEMSLSPCSSSSSLNTSQHVTCHSAFTRQHNGLIVAP